MPENIVIDTNLLISSLLFKNSIPRQAFQKAINEFKIVTSSDCFLELKEVIFRPKFEKYIIKSDAMSFLNNYLILSKFIEITHNINICRDPKDNKFLELAVSSNSKILLTGDKDLLVLEKYLDVFIYSPIQFLNLKK